MKKNILLINGGNNTEHEISLLSGQFIKKSLTSYTDFNITEFTIEKNDKKIDFTKLLNNIDFAIPCIHGYPGETGDIQSMFEMFQVPYLGCGPEANILSFNKVSSKLWYSSAKIPNVPYIFLSNQNELPKAQEALAEFKKVFVKASSQGSSVGSYPATTEKELTNAINKAFQYSPYVLIEKMIEGRELEIAVYEWNGEVFATVPGEIGCPNGFYTYDEKYNDNSNTKTTIEATDINDETILKMKKIAIKAFKLMKLRHLSRVDFFLTSNNEILLNEINTFPGMTSISMFPKMMEASGHSFKEFLYQIIKNNI